MMAGFKFNYESTPEEILSVKRDVMFCFRYATATIGELKSEFSIAKSTISKWAKRLGIKRHPEFKNTGQFASGSTSWNKGMKGLPVHPNSVKTQFKKGVMPKNHLPVGSIQFRMRHNRSRHTGFYIKIAEPNVWKELRHYIWEKHNPPVQKGQVLWLKNQDLNDLRIENMEVITDRECRFRNSASIHLSDSFVAYTIATKNNPGLIKELVAKYPELIELKRAQLVLNRELKAKN